MKTFYRIVLIGLFLAWMAGWFWIFTFAFSSGFFKYHLDTRLPILFLALLAVAVPPLSGYWAINRTIRQKIHPARSFFLNLLLSGLPVFGFWAVFALWVKIAHGFGKVPFEADEAMGNGIDFMLCLAVYIASNIVVAFTLFSRKILECIDWARHR